MNQYKTRATLMGEAKVHMYGKYGPAIGAYILMQLFLFTLTMAVSGLLPEGIIGRVIYYAFCAVLALIEGVYTAGLTYLYLNIACGNQVRANMIFYGFHNCAEKAVLLKGFIFALEIAVSLPLFFLLFIQSMSDNNQILIFVIIAAIISIVGICLVELVFLPTFYVLHDFPDYSVKKILQTSVNLMKGNVGRLFVINLSIVPLQLLGLLSFGIGMLWVEAYRQEVWAEFYLDLMRPASIDS